MGKIAQIYSIAPFNVVQFMKVTLARDCVNLKSNFKEHYRKKINTPNRIRIHADIVKQISKPALYPLSHGDFHVLHHCYFLQ